jgi:uncharacterized protein YkwD
MHDKDAVKYRVLPLLLITLLIALAPDVQAAESFTVPAFEGYTYTVRPGDTLWDIALAHGVSLEALVRANDRLDPAALQVGQKILIPGAAPQPAPVEVPVGLAPELAGWPPALLGEINARRAEQGLAALRWSDTLAAAAQGHAEDCARRNRGSHTGSDGSSLRDRFDRVGYRSAYASENWANSRSLQHAFSLWWNEPATGSHRRNILSPNYDEIGIGVARGSWGYYVVVDFAGD